MTTRELIGLGIITATIAAVLSRPDAIPANLALLAAAALYGAALQAPRQTGLITTAAALALTTFWATAR